MTTLLDRARPTSSLDSTDAAPGATARRRLVLVVLAVLLVATLGVLAWLLAAGGGSADAVQRSREEVMAQTRQFMLRMGTYGPDQLEGNELPEYRDLVSEVITPKLEASFDRQVSAAEQIVSQAGVARTAEVFSTGVATLSDDSATALVAGTFTDAYPTREGELDPQEPVPFRIQLTLVKSDGEWLVDDFTSVTGGEK